MNNTQKELLESQKLTIEKFTDMEKLFHDLEMRFKRIETNLDSFLIKIQNLKANVK